MLADQPLCARLHRGDVERLVHHQRTPMRQRRARNAVEDQVTVAAREGAEAGMEIVGHRLCPVQADVARQVAVGAEQPGARAARGLGIEVRHLRARVHAGIGTAGADEPDGLVGDAAQAASSAI